MKSRARALTEQQAKDVWTILVRCCGARDGVAAGGAFARLMSACLAPVRWTFDAPSGSAAFCFPEMRVINRVSVPSESWVAMVQRANEEIQRILPAGALIECSLLSDPASKGFTQATASPHAREVGILATAGGDI